MPTSDERPSSDGYQLTVRSAVHRLPGVIGCKDSLHLCGVTGDKRLAIDGLAGQFAVGLLLGTFWNPCAGPTLGAASLLAAQGQSLGMVVVTMLLFGIAAAVPSIGLGLVSCRMLLKWRSKLLSGGRCAKVALGLAFFLFGAAVLTGIDKHVETALVDLTPDWLTSLTARY